MNFVFLFYGRYPQISSYGEEQKWGETFRDVAKPIH